MAERGGSLREANVAKGIANGHDPARDLPPLLSILPLPRPILHDPLHIVILVGRAASVRQVVAAGVAVGVHVAGDRDAGAGEAVAVLEGGGAAAEGARGGACAHAVRAGVEDEGGEFRSEQGAESREEAEELQRGDQVGPNHVVLALPCHSLPRFLCRSGAPFLQNPALRLINIIIEEQGMKLTGSEFCAAGNENGDVEGKGKHCCGNNWVIYI